MDWPSSCHLSTWTPWRWKLGYSQTPWPKQHKPWGLHVIAIVEAGRRAVLAKSPRVVSACGL